MRFVGPARPSPSDEEIRAIACDILRAWGRRRPEDSPASDVLSIVNELSPADEGRVIAALAALGLPPRDAAGG